MTINLTFPQTMQELRPRITVVGVGGAGCNAVNNMINANLEGVDFLVANTDGQALAHSLSSRKIQLGSAITQGLGAGSKPEIGRAAAEESIEDVMAELADCNMVFITAGMGGGTGTGAAPVIARTARERGILTVGVITKPFEFEGQRRMKQAESGIEELQDHVDTLIIIPNQNLFRLANERTTFADAFHMADTVLHQGVCGVTDLMIKPGQINLDFADIRAVMSEMGKAMMGTGEASGEARATQAAEAAINNPLLDDTTMKGANAVLINITGGLDMTLFEVDEAANRIRKEVEPDATIIFGSAFDEKLDGVMRVSVVATGISSNSQFNSRPNMNSNEIQTNLSNQDKIFLRPITSNAKPSETKQSEVGIISPIKLDLANDTKADTKSKTNDLASQLANELANDAIASLASSAEDHSAQMDIQEAIEKTPKNSGNLVATSDLNHEESLNDSSKVEFNSSILERLSLADQNGKATTPKKESFIPDEMTNIPDEETIAKGAKLPLSQPQSLINRISGLWSNKPHLKTNASDGKTVKESRLNEEAAKNQIAGSILDLSKSDIVKKETDNSGVIPENSHDEELDIPAFLRRQAN